MFQTLFYQPILNLLVFLYNTVPGHDLGVAIVILTVIIKLALYPLSQKSLKSQKALQDLQPKIDEIKKRHADKKEEIGKAIMELYRRNKVNPLSSCLPLLIQLPFLYAVFKVFRVGLENGSLDLVYSFIGRPESINPVSFGFLDLSKTNFYLALLAGLAQFWQTKMMMGKKPAIKSPGAKDENMMAMMNKQMMYFMPIITVVIAMKFPAGLALYWFITTILTALQQMILFKQKDETKNNGGVLTGEVVK